MALSRDWPLSRFSPATTSTWRQRPLRTSSRASISIAAPVAPPNCRLCA
jgi:hypothetical protein